MNGTQLISAGAAIQGSTDTQWKVIGAGDFNGDGKADILWHNVGTGQAAVWLMDGTQLVSAGAAIQGSSDTRWKVIGAGDFNGDGKADILWHNVDTGQAAVWLMNGTQLLSAGAAIQGSTDTLWKVIGAGDFNGDGKADILWQNVGTGQAAVWLMNGTQLVSAGNAI